MKFNLVVLFSVVLSTWCIDMDRLNLIISFVVHDERAASVLAVHLCWSVYEVTTLAKALANENINIGFTLQPNRTEHFLQHILVVADLTCPGAAAFLINASNTGYFKAPYRWLLLDLEDGDHLDDLDQLEILVDSDVVVARKVKDRTVFTDVYRISKKSEVICTDRLAWRSHDINFFKHIEDSNKNITKEIYDGSEDLKSVITRPDEENKEVNSKFNPKSITITSYGVMEDYRQSKVLSVRRRDFRGHVLTIANVITDSNNTKQHLSDRLFLHQDSITKMSYMVVKICFDMLNATENQIFTPTWGYKDKNGNWQGVIDHLVKKEADLATLTTFTQERMKVVDYIAMVGVTKLRFVFREPPLSSISNIFTMPFTGGVWLAIFISILGCALFLYITSKWEVSMGLNPPQLNGSWSDVLIVIIGAVLQQGCTLEPKYAAGRCVTLLLYVALTVLFAAYSANMVVLLRATSSSVRSLSDLLNSPLEFGASDFEYNRYFFKKLNDPIRKAIYDQKIAPKGKKPNFYTMEEGVEKIRKGLFAFHMETNPGYRLIQETYQEDEKCDLVEMDYINEIVPWVPGQKRSPFRDHFKINFIKIRETGIQACIHHRLHVPRPRCSGSVSAFSSVGITDMYPAMLGALYVMMMVPAVLLMEIAHKRLMTIRQRKKQLMTTQALAD